MAITIPYPLVRGVAYDFSSIQATFGLVPIIGIKSIDYSSQKTPGDVWGTSAKRIGRTRGQLKHSGSFTIYKKEWAAFVALFSATVQVTGNANAALMDTEFDVKIAYADNGQPPEVDVLKSCIITQVSDSHSAGSDALVVKVDLDIMDISYNGAPLLGNLQNLKPLQSP